MGYNTSREFRSSFILLINDIILDTIGTEQFSLDNLLQDAVSRLYRIAFE